MGKYQCTDDLLFDWFGLVCFANKNKICQSKYSWFQTSQTGGQRYSDTSPLSIPWLVSKSEAGHRDHRKVLHLGRRQPYLQSKQHDRVRWKEWFFIIDTGCSTNPDEFPVSPLTSGSTSGRLTTWSGPWPKSLGSLVPGAVLIKLFTSVIYECS